MISDAQLGSLVDRTYDASHWHDRCFLPILIHDSFGKQLILVTTRIPTIGKFSFAPRSGKRRVLIIGGGLGGLRAARDLRREFNVTVVDSQRPLNICDIL